MGVWLLINLFKATATPISAVGNVLDQLFTSDDERLTREQAMKALQQKPQLAQAEINKIEAQHKSLFVAGWRPFIGWVCGINLAYLVCVRDWIAWIVNTFGLQIATPPAIGVDMTAEIVVALLGLGGLRTLEKLNGRSK